MALPTLEPWKSMEGTSQNYVRFPRFSSREYLANDLRACERVCRRRLDGLDAANRYAERINTVEREGWDPALWGFCP